MREEKVLIPSAGIQLEGLLNIHEAFSFRISTIFCHPHPQYGGDMNNPVITAAVEVAFEEGLSTLRFNFRGVGESGGAYEEGVGEREDVHSAIEYLSSKFKDHQHSIILLGYSFGAWVGLPIAVQDKRVIGMVVIAPPLESYDFGLLKGCKKEKLIISGNQDLFCPSPMLEEWYESIDEPKSLIILSGADHFLFSHIHLLSRPLREFFKRLSFKAEHSL